MATALLAAAAHLVMSLSWIEVMVYDRDGFAQSGSHCRDGMGWGSKGLGYPPLRHRPLQHHQTPAPWGADELHNGLVRRHGIGGIPGGGAYRPDPARVLLWPHAPRSKEYGYLGRG